MGMHTNMLGRAVMGLAILAAGASAHASELTVYHGARLVEHIANDGDSFHVQAGDQRLHIRLYFADSPETVVHHHHDARRIQEQARYFGVTDPDRVLELGEQAKAFTREVLSRPFTVYTAHVRALGGPTSERIYGFVVTEHGRDLAELLVENGLARNFGVRRERYDGMSQADMETRLRDLEISAMLAHRGIWLESDPNRIVEYRAQQRAEKQTNKLFMSSAVQLLEQPIDINHATQRELERIPGIGPVLASRIINQRPYRAVEDIQSVPGISKKTFRNILPYLRVDDAGGRSNG